MFCTARLITKRIILQNNFQGQSYTSDPRAPDIPGSGEPGETPDQVKPIILPLQEICKRKKKSARGGHQRFKIIFRTGGYFLSSSY